MLARLDHNTKMPNLRTVRDVARASARIVQLVEQTTISICPGELQRYSLQ